MKLDTRTVSTWPRLGWVAEAHAGSSTVEVRVGESVEHGSDYAVEAVWDGPFSELGFDRTDLVFGSGLLVRDGEVVFVSSATTVDRLWLIEESSSTLISNSLPLLLARAKVRLSHVYRRYTSDVASICSGLDRYARALPSEGPDVRVVYYDNLHWDGHRIRAVSKALGPGWRDYREYRAYLSFAARAIGENAQDSVRAATVTPIATVSTGYDSPAAAVIAGEAGAQTALTIANARSVVPRSDDGSTIAAALGMVCQRRVMRRKGLYSERSFIAALGWSMDINMSLFDYPDPVTLLFTGFHGDRAWDPARGVPDSNIVRGDPSGLGLAEFRLAHGIIHSPVPFWGVRHQADVTRISRSHGMSKWSVGSDYDRPVPRRIAEEAGVPRRAFGLRKKATTVDWHYHWPLTRTCRADFTAWLKHRGIAVPPAAVVDVQQVVEGRLLAPLRSVSKRGRPLRRHLPASTHLFAWANNTEADRFGS